MQTLKDVRNEKIKLRLEICQTQAQLREMYSQLKELDEVEVMMFAREVGTTKCPTFDFNSKKSKSKRKKPTDSISEKFKTLSKEEQANLLQLLGMEENNDNNSDGTNQTGP